MNSIDEKIIEFSKTKLVQIILACCVFVALGVWLFSIDDARIRSSRSFRFFLNNPMYAHGLGLLAIVFFGFCGIILIKKLIDKKPGLIFNSSGFIDNASGVSAGFIPWSEVTGSQLLDLQRQRLLIIMVADPEKYAERGSLFKRTFNKANYKMCGSPIAISSNALKVDFSELVSLFNQYQQKYGRAPESYRMDLNVPSGSIR